MSSKFNGDRLKTARIYRSMTLAELGKSLDLSKQTLSLYENNKGNPDFSTVIKLSKTLHFPINYFFQEKNINITSGTTYFRSLSSTSKKSRSAEITKVEFIGALYEALYNYIEFPVLNLPKININSQNLKDEEIENVAIKLREFWDLGYDPINDLQYTLEENGLIVTGMNVADQRIDAYSQVVNIDGIENYIIVLSVGNKGKARINFDLAHELGHILLHPWTEDIETLSNDEFKDRERQANKFASSLLLPKETFSKDCSRYPTELEYYIRLKKKWGVSIQAMLYRACDLDIISNNQFQYLMRQISSKGWRKKEPGDTPHVLNENIFKMGIELLLDNNYTKQDVTNIFEESSINLFSDEIEELLNLPSKYLNVDDKPKNNIIELKLNKH
ncbi:TPA: helix-turn-helix domain-containing protein [Streptococcus pyogenes]|uniref:helix-turn-helix domain-containing protein n=1 Tax=unclassified Streptococcus TaxID=2608887 RepID=UPI00107285A7|nr:MULTISPECIES: XRE family transcriptional regulator [unclassified Streptococcus]MBF0787066.1 XRE family transcriptional regulator [Streptococcus sp. 19428wC2_LYSM12]MDU4672048.1 XRE family transcriptional regulator [Finegoldia magna]TFV06103.1 ImmA/IrrE family metallo-endopeptidase [Streptococcus sp. LYSM12]